jgi:tetrahydromethanopterin S-methyltransferase subunit B
MDALDLISFDIADMNFRLKKVPRIYADAYEHGLEPTKQSMNLLERKYKQAQR